MNALIGGHDLLLVTLDTLRYDVAAELATSTAQVYALVRRHELPALKLGGRGQWRVERERLEAFIAQAYTDTERYIEQHPFTGDVDDAGDTDA